MMEYVRIESKHDILSILHANRDRLQALGVKRIGLFGSYVRGEQHSGSDVDLLVEFETGRKSFDAFIELAFWLEAIMQRKIELVTVESLSPYIGPYVMREVEFADIAA
jgi:predicted nucleotidyltransferase